MSPMLRFLLAMILLAALAGCTGATSAPTPSRYVLTTPPATTALPPSGTALLATVGISPVRLAAYLDTTAMVTINDKSHVHSAAYHRWAAPPREAVAQALASDLADLTYGYRFESALSGITAQWTFRIDIYLERFNAVADGGVAMAGHWRLVNAQDHQLIAEAPFGYRGSSRAGDYTETATGLRDLVGTLAGAIAAELPPAVWKTDSD